MVQYYKIAFAKDTNASLHWCVSCNLATLTVNYTCMIYYIRDCTYISRASAVDIPRAHCCIICILCTVKSSLTTAAAFMILAIIATFVSMLLYFPLWHWAFFIAGAILAVLSGQILSAWYR